MSLVIAGMTGQESKTMVMGGANVINCGVSKVENKGFSSTDVINKGLA